MDPLIELQAVTVHAQEHISLDEVSVAFPSGRSTVIMGPSGSGKSMLLKVAAAIIPPDSGRVLKNGKNLLRLSQRTVGGRYANPDHIRFAEIRKHPDARKFEWKRRALHKGLLQVFADSRSLVLADVAQKTQRKMHAFGFHPRHTHLGASQSRGQIINLMANAFRDFDSDERTHSTCSRL